MMKFHTLVSSAWLLAALSLPVAAQNPGAGAPHPAPATPTQQIENSNAPATGDQAKGLDRAQERMSEQGKQHENATTPPKLRRQAKSKQTSPSETITR
jgi:hypothetical protein